MGAIKRHGETLALVLIILAFSVAVVNVLAEYQATPSASVAAGTYTNTAINLAKFLSFIILVSMFAITLIVFVIRFFGTQRRTARV